MPRHKSDDLPKWIWLWCMPVPLIIHLAARYLDSDGEFFARMIESESGIIENGTALILIPAAAIGFQLGWRFFRSHGAAYLLWFGAFGLMCFGFAGEEISWGQHWVGWNSPEFFVENNRQGETNIHNINIHFGRIVKSILTLAIIVGGLIIPLRGSSPPLLASPSDRFLDTILPTTVCVPAAAFVFGVRLIERFKTWFDLDWFVLSINLKESQELYIAIFLFLYAWSLQRRIAAARQY